MSGLSERVKTILESTNEPTTEEIASIKMECSDDPQIMQHELWGPWFGRNIEVIMKFNDQTRALTRPALDLNAQMLELLREAIKSASPTNLDDLEAVGSFCSWFDDWMDRAHTLVRSIEGKTRSST